MGLTGHGWAVDIVIIIVVAIIILAILAWFVRPLLWSGVDLNVMTESIKNNLQLQELRPMLMI